MRIIRHLNVLRGHKLVVVLGTFDGVHRGHQRVISEAVKYARKNSYEVAVVTLDPHPQLVVAPHRGMRLLTLVAEKAHRMQALGVDYLVLQRYDQKLRSLSAEQYVKKYLVDIFKAKAVFVGYDHAFGKNRKGHVKDLKKMGEKHGFTVKVVLPVLSRFFPIKSSLIRSEIAGGNFNWAVDLLGHPYLISGLVRKGEGRGRTLGFPTLNLKVPKEKLIPAHGIFAGWVRVADKRLPAAIYIGSRPTFPEKNVTIEAHLISPAGAKETARNVLNGKKVTYELVRRIRPDRQFADVEELKRAIAQDISECRRILKA